MTAPVPEGDGEPADVEIKWEIDDLGITIEALLGDASVTVQHAWDAAEEAATLAQALPQILMAVQQAIDSQQEEA